MFFDLQLSGQKFKGRLGRRCLNKQRDIKLFLHTSTIQNIFLLFLVTDHRFQRHFDNHRDFANLFNLSGHTDDAQNTSAALQKQIDARQNAVVVVFALNHHRFHMVLNHIVGHLVEFSDSLLHPAGRNNNAIDVDDIYVIFRVLVNFHQKAFCQRFAESVGHKTHLPIFLFRQAKENPFPRSSFPSSFAVWLKGAFSNSNFP